MARLGDAIAGSTEQPGGRPHQLPGLLAELDPDDADDLRAALVAGVSAVLIQRQVEALYPHVTRYSTSTWQKWSVEARSGRQF